jgi:predicted Fe-S protein YdhL (DUF1289 family)
LSFPPSRIPSPCIDRCLVDEHDICEGCFRSVKEIGKWYKSSDEKKLKILKNCSERKLKAQANKDDGF